MNDAVTWRPLRHSRRAGSILIGLALALSRRGRYGLAALDGLDYRHPGDSTQVGTRSRASTQGRRHHLEVAGPHRALTR
jgi:hypothetical protein